MRDIGDVFSALDKSKFRSRFKLCEKDFGYLKSKGLPTVLDHARKFIAERLAPANPLNDGKQTPMRNHPVFVAQHATATCCRGCLEKWHLIPRGRGLTDAEQEYVVAVIQFWLSRQIETDRTGT